MNLSFLVKVREWDVPGNPLLHEFSLQADSMVAAIKKATGLFHAKYPDKNIRKYFLHVRHDLRSKYRTGDLSAPVARRAPAL